MIVKMSKYAFMVFHKEYDTFLSTLRDLGVVHIKETNSVMDNERLQELLAERKQINTLMRYFKNLHAAEKDVKFAPARELTKEEGLKLSLIHIFHAHDIIVHEIAVSYMMVPCAYFP